MVRNLHEIVDKLLSGVFDYDNGKLSFSVTDRKAKHWLVFYDRKTKKPLAKYSVDNAQSDLKELNKSKKKKKK